MSTISGFLEWLMTQPAQHKKWKEDKGSKANNDAKKNDVISLWEQQTSSRLSADQRKLIQDGDPVALRQAVMSEGAAAGSTGFSLLSGSLLAQGSAPYVYCWP